MTLKLGHTFPSSSLVIVAVVLIVVVVVGTLECLRKDDVLFNGKVQKKIIWLLTENLLSF